MEGIHCTSVKKLQESFTLIQNRAHIRVDETLASRPYTRTLRVLGTFTRATLS